MTDNQLRSLALLEQENLALHDRIRQLQAHNSELVLKRQEAEQKVAGIDMILEAADQEVARMKAAQCQVGSEKLRTTLMQMVDSFDNARDAIVQEMERRRGPDRRQRIEDVDHMRRKRFRRSTDKEPSMRGTPQPEIER